CNGPGSACRGKVPHAPFVGLQLERVIIEPADKIHVGSLWLKGIVIAKALSSLAQLFFLLQCLLFYDNDDMLGTGMQFKNSLVVKADLSDGSFARKVDTHALLIYNFCFVPRVVDAKLFLLIKSKGMSEARQAPGAITAHTGIAAVGVAIEHDVVIFFIFRGKQCQESVGSNTKFSITELWR